MTTEGNSRTGTELPSETPVGYTSSFEGSSADLFDDAPCGFLSTLPGGLIVRVNRTFLEWTGHAREDLVGKVRFQDMLTPGGRIYYETHYAPLLRMQGDVREIAVDIRTASGAKLPALVNSTQRTGDDGTPLLVRTVVFKATDRRLYEEELREARRHERSARERLERLQRISAALAAALSATEIADAVVRELARDMKAVRAVLALGDEKKGLEVLAAHNLDSAVRDQLAGSVSRPDSLVAKTLHAVEPRVFEGDAPAAPGFDAGATIAALPLVVDGEATGILLASFEPDRELTADDHVFMSACAGQSAQALARARLHAETARIAHTLQQSLLSSAWPEDPRFDIATYYHSAVESLDVGGDWYDAFEVAPERIMLVVGDVVGRGLDAASAMGQLRSAVRALGAAGFAPGELLARLDRYVAGANVGRMATIALVEVEIRTGRTRFACAGHPPPVVVEPDGEPRMDWRGRSTPLGLARSERPEAELTLDPGSRVILYTDGLVESRSRPIDDGLRRLSDEVRSRSFEAPARLVESLARTLLAGEHGGDDTCVLCFELTSGRAADEPADGPASRGRTEAAR